MLYRQGDVLIRRVSKDKITGTKRERKEGDRVILAFGEVTGHAHVFIPRNVCGFYKEGEETASYISVTDAPAPLTHEEHDTIMLDPGEYEIVRQREYDMMEGVRKVAD